MKIAGSPFSARGGIPSFIVIDPTGKFAYIGNVGSNDVSGYAISLTTGAPEEIAGSPFASGAAPLCVAVDPLGKFLYTVNSVSDNISVFTINATTGALTEIATSPFPTATFSSPVAMAIHPTASFAYVTNYVGNVAAYAIDAATGALTEISGSPFRAGSYPFSIVTVEIEQ